MTDPTTPATQPTPAIPDRPMLRGERVWLRPLEERDMPAFVAGVNDTEVGGWAGYRWPTTVATASEWLTRVSEQERTQQGFHFAVCELGDDGFIGTIWLRDISLLDGVGELAIFMDKDHLGGGWGTDAQVALLAFGFGTLRLERIWLTVDAHNARAIRSYQKAGFRQEGVMRKARQVNGVRVDGLLMAILREEWQPEPEPAA
jgi:RimJ/RimL family protein N-acetyltransferase